MAHESFTDRAREHLQWACGVRGWSPYDFWQLTPREVVYAWQGWCRHLGILPELPLGRADIDALMQQFPDK